MLDNLLENSKSLNSEFSRIFEYGPVDDRQRITASCIMCFEALGYSGSLRHLSMCGNFIRLSNRALKSHLYVERTIL